MIDRPNLGGGRSRGRFFTSVGAEDFDPFTARDVDLDGIVGEGLFMRGTPLSQPDPTPDGPGSIRNPKPSRAQLDKPNAENIGRVSTESKPTKPLGLTRPDERGDSESLSSGKGKRPTDIDAPLTDSEKRSIEFHEPSERVMAGWDRAIRYGSLSYEQIPAFFDWLEDGESPQGRTGSDAMWEYFIRRRNVLPNEKRVSDSLIRKTRKGAYMGERTRLRREAKKNGEKPSTFLGDRNQMSKIPRPTTEKPITRESLRAAEADRLRQARLNSHMPSQADMADWDKPGENGLKPFKDWVKQRKIQKRIAESWRDDYVPEWEYYVRREQGLGNRGGVQPDEWRTTREVNFNRLSSGSTAGNYKKYLSTPAEKRSTADRYKYDGPFHMFKDNELLSSGKTKPTDPVTPEEQKKVLDEAYAKLTEEMIAEIQRIIDNPELLQKGTKGWIGIAGRFPQNPTTQRRPYQGMNTLILQFAKNARMYRTAHWAGLGQWKKMGGKLKKGSEDRGVSILAPNRFQTGIYDSVGNLIGSYRGFHVTTVYNADEFDGLPDEMYGILPDVISEEQRIEDMESIIEEIGPDWQEIKGSDQAAYAPSLDRIVMPGFVQFKSPLNFYKTLFHETVHWTGHNSRLNRFIPGFSFDMQSQDYAAEELVAELGSSFALGMMGMDAPMREDHAVYLAGWLGLLKSDPDALKKAITKAQQAVNFLMEKSPTMRQRSNIPDSEVKAPDAAIEDVPDINLPNALSSGRAMAAPLDRRRARRAREVMGATSAERNRAMAERLGKEIDELGRIVKAKGSPGSENYAGISGFVIRDKNGRIYDQTNRILSSGAQRGPIKHRTDEKRSIKRTDGSMIERYGFKVEPTEEQRDIIDAAVHLSQLSQTDDGTLVAVRAGAGAGKTTTLEWAATAVSRENPAASIYYITFARKNADEARSRMPENTGVSTINQLAYWSLREGDGDEMFGAGTAKKVELGGMPKDATYYPPGNSNYREDKTVTQFDGTVVTVPGLKKPGLDLLGYITFEKDNGGPVVAKHYDLENTFGTQTVNQTVIEPTEFGDILNNALTRFSIGGDDEPSAKHFVLTESQKKAHDRKPSGSVVDTPFTEESIPAEWVEQLRKMWSDIINPETNVVPTFDHQVKMWALTKPTIKTSGGLLGHGSTDEVATKKQHKDLPIGSIVMDRGLPHKIVQSHVFGGRRLQRVYATSEKPLDVFMFDEAQDVNEVLQKVISDNVANKQLKAVMVGDPRQAIFGFRGSSDTFANLTSDYDLTLRDSFRYGKTVAYLGNLLLSRMNRKDREEGKTAEYQLFGRYQDIVRADFNIDGLEGAELVEKLAKLETKYGTDEKPLNLSNLSGDELKAELAIQADRFAQLAEGVIAQDMRDMDVIIARTNVGMIQEGLGIALAENKIVGIPAKRHAKILAFLKHYQYVLDNERGQIPPGKKRPPRSEIIGNAWTMKEIRRRTGQAQYAEANAILGLFKITNPVPAPDGNNYPYTPIDLIQMMEGTFDKATGEKSDRVIKPVFEALDVDAWREYTVEKMKVRAARKGGKSGAGQSGAYKEGRGENVTFIPNPPATQTARTEVWWSLGRTQDQGAYGEWDGSMVLGGDGIMSTYEYTTAKGETKVQAAGPQRGKLERYIESLGLGDKIQIIPNGAPRQGDGTDLSIPRKPSKQLKPKKTENRPRYDIIKVKGETDEETVEIFNKLGKFLSDNANTKDFDFEVVTGHQAKGLEWNRVRLAADWAMSAPKFDGNGNITEDIDREEEHLLYVASTRARMAIDPGRGTSWIFDERTNPGFSAVTEDLTDEQQRPAGFWNPYDGVSRPPAGYDDTTDRLASGALVVGPTVGKFVPKNGNDRQLLRDVSRQRSVVETIKNSPKIAFYAGEDAIMPSVDDILLINNEPDIDEGTLARLASATDALGKASNKLWARSRMDSPDASPSEKKVARKIISSGETLSSGRSERRVIRTPQEVKSKMAYDWGKSGFKFRPTEEQETVSDAVVTGQDVIVTALAGTGKTTTLRLVAKRMLDQEPDKRVVYLTFTKKMQEEAEQAFRDYPNVEVRTWDSVAYAGVVGKSKKMQAKTDTNTDGLILTNSFSSVRDHYGLESMVGVDEYGEGIEVDGFEQAMIMSRVLRDFSTGTDKKIGTGSVMRQAAGLNITLTADMAREIRNNAQRMWEDSLDPDTPVQLDRSYILKAWALTNPDLSTGNGMRNNTDGNDVLFFDEAQDANPVMSAIVRGQGIQKVIVGDSNQAIYAFRGAVDELEKFDSPYNLALTETFRFGPQVAGIANRILAAHERKFGRDNQKTPKSATLRVVGGGPDGEILFTADELPDGIDKAANRKVIDGKAETFAYLSNTNGQAFKKIIAGQRAGLRTASVSTFKQDLIDMIEHAEWLRRGKPTKSPKRRFSAFNEYDTWQDLQISLGLIEPPPGVKPRPANIQAGTAYKLMDEENFDFDFLRSAVDKIETTDELGNVSDAPISAGQIKAGESIEIVGNGVMSAKVEGKELTLNFTNRAAFDEFMLRKPIFAGKIGFKWDGKSKVWKKAFTSEDNAAEILNNLRTMVRDGIRAESGGDTDFDSLEKMRPGVARGSMAGVFAELGAPDIGLSFSPNGSGGYRAEITGNTYNLLGKDGPVKNNFKAAKVWRWDGAKKAWYTEATSEQDLFDKISRTRQAVGIATGGGEGGYIVPPMQRDADDNGPDFIAMTAHRSKGLEFDYVVALDDFAQPESFKEDKKIGSEDEDEKNPLDEISSEDLRLQYVAATRAKKVLVLGSLEWIYRITNEDDEKPKPKSGTLSSGATGGNRAGRRASNVAQRSTGNEFLASGDEGGRISRRTGRESLSSGNIPTAQRIAGMRLSGDPETDEDAMSELRYAIRVWDGFKRTGIALDTDSPTADRAEKNREIQVAMRKVGARMGTRPKVTVGNVSSNQNNDAPTAANWMLPVDKLRDTIRIPTEYSTQTDSQTGRVTSKWTQSRPITNEELGELLSLDRQNMEKLSQPGAGINHDAVRFLVAEIGKQPEFSGWRLFASVTDENEISGDDASVRAARKFQENIARANMRDRFIIETFGKDAFPHWLDEEENRVISPDDFDDLGNVSRSSQFRSSGRFYRDSATRGDSEAENTLLEESIDEVGLRDIPEDGVTAEEIRADKTARQDFELKPLLNYLGIPSDGWRKILRERLQQSSGDENVGLADKNDWDKNGVPIAYINHMIRLGMIPDASSVWKDGDSGNKLDAELSNPRHAVIEALNDFIDKSFPNSPQNSSKSRSYISGIANMSAQLADAAKNRGSKFSPGKGDEPRYSSTELQQIVNRFNEVFGTNHTIEDIFSREQIETARKRIEEEGQTLSGKKRLGTRKKNPDRFKDE
jgi:antirestriction protein ArdC/superfamily I DNA/RNA helicase